jgi:hypothetical protein
VERIVFLVEETGERVSCLLNPETVSIRRWSGVTELPFELSPLNANVLSDDPVALTGGGRTEIELDLLFDVDLEPSKPPVEDIRILTIPLWRLTENAVRVESLTCVPTVWILWGREWSILCVIEAIAERFDNIGPTGAPRRSWISLRARRVSDVTMTLDAGTAGVPTTKPLAAPDAPIAVTATGDGRVVGGFEGVRLDLVAAQLLGDPAQWRAISEANGIEDPMRVAAGTVLSAPTATVAQ